jgi:hypothetical protein
MKKSQRRKRVREHLFFSIAEDTGNAKKKLFSEKKKSNNCEVMNIGTIVVQIIIFIIC